MSLEAARGLYTLTHTLLLAILFVWNTPSSPTAASSRIQLCFRHDMNFRDLPHTLNTSKILQNGRPHYDRCRIWPYKQPISLTLSNHMLLTIIYLITHLHVRAGSRPSPPVQRKYVKASCPGMEIITEPSTKGIVLWGDQPSSEPMPRRAVILEATVFL